MLGEDVRECLISQAFLTFDPWLFDRWLWVKTNGTCPCSNPAAEKPAPAAPAHVPRKRLRGLSERQEVAAGRVAPAQAGGGGLGPRFPRFPASASVHSSRGHFHFHSEPRDPSLLRKKSEPQGKQRSVEKE